MISDKYKCAFIHIPKTAGMSVEKWLGLNVSKFHSKSSMDEKHGTPNGKRHRRCFHKDLNFFKFTTVRNPWDRAVSAFYHDLMMIETNPNKKRSKIKKFHEQYADEAFAEYVNSDSIRKDRLINRDWFWRNQAFWLKPHIHNLAPYDYICRFENLKEDINKIKKILAVADEFPYINGGVKPQKHYSYFYDDESINRIGELYKEDITMLKYEFSKA